MAKFHKIRRYEGMKVAIFAYRATGAGVAVLLMEFLAFAASEPLSRVPFVTSIVLVSALPDSPPAQPRAIIGGHMVSSIVGWIISVIMGSGEAVGAVAVAAATMMMLALGCVHPPAGLDGFLIATNGLPAKWIVSPVLVGAILLAVYSRLVAFGERRWLRG